MTTPSTEPGRGPAPLGVLFVCHGNICRSPLAEGIFEHLATQRGARSEYTLDSAGVSDYHAGEPPHRDSIRVAATRGIDISAQRSRPLVAGDFHRFGWLLAMDRQNLRDMAKIAPRGHEAQVRLMLDFGDAGARDGLLDVPDPYWGGPDGFVRVYDLLHRACSGLLDELERARSAAAR